MPSRARCRLWSLILGVALLAGPGCVFSDAVADEVEPDIVCADDGECPAGFTCRAALARCVRASALDEDPPTLREARITPAAGTVGTVFELELSADKPLTRPPTVRVDVGGTLTEALFVEGDDPTYRYRYRATGDELQGARAVEADLLDRSGNLTAGALVGQLRLDFDAPMLSDAQLSPAAAAATDTIALAVTLSEPLSTTPVAVLEHPDGDELPIALTGEGASFTGDMPLTGDEREGEWSLRVSGADAAGNPFDDAPPGAVVVLDFTAPTLVEADVIPAFAGPGTLVKVAATFSESLPSPPALLAEASGEASLPFEVESVSGEIVTFRYLVREGDEGVFDLTLGDAVDAAGNVTSFDTPVAQVTLDASPPALSDFTQSHTSAQASDTLQVTFSTDEPLGGEPVVLLDTAPLTRVGAAVAPFVFELDLSTTALEGTLPISVSLSDQAANSITYAAGFVDVDTRAPELLAVELTPTVAPAGRTALLIVTADEPLGDNPELTFSSPAGDPGFVWVSSFGLSHTFALATPTGDESYALESVRLRDEAGNEAVASPPAPTVFVADNTPPEIVSLTTDRDRYSEVAPYDTMTIDVELDELLPSDGLRVSVGAATPPCVLSTSSPPVYTCTLDVTPVVVTDPGEVVLAVAVDDAGNASTAAKSVLIDFTAPAVVAGTVTLALTPDPSVGVSVPDRATFGTDIGVTFVVTEELGSSPGVATTTPAVLPFAATSQAGQLYRFTHRVIDGSAVEGTYDLQATLTDTVGHVAVVDVTLPPPGIVVLPVISSPCIATEPDGTELCTDYDGDGVVGYSSACPTGTDCNDSNPLVFPGAVEIPGDAWDNGCTGAGDAPIDDAAGVFVSPTGRAGALGTRADPFDTLGEAIASAASPPWVFVADGTYAEDLGGLISVDGVVGGLDPVTWQPTGGRSVFTGVLGSFSGSESVVIASVETTGALNLSAQGDVVGRDVVVADIMRLFADGARFWRFELRRLDVQVQGEARFADGGFFGASSYLLVEGGRATVFSARDIPQVTISNAAASLRLLNSEWTGGSGNCTPCAIEVWQSTMKLAVFSDLLYIEDGNPGLFVGNAFDLRSFTVAITDSSDVSVFDSAVREDPQTVLLTNATGNYYATPQGMTDLETDGFGAGNSAYATLGLAPDGLHLDASSPLVDSGANALARGGSTYLARDIDGDCRGATDWDVGADER